jgi:hypothetical protein
MVEAGIGDEVHTRGDDPAIHPAKVNEHLLLLPDAITPLETVLARPNPSPSGRC